MHTCIYRPVAHRRTNHTCHWPKWKITTALPRLQSLQQSTGEKVVLLSRSAGRPRNEQGHTPGNDGDTVQRNNWRHCRHSCARRSAAQKLLLAAASSSSSSWTACIHGPARRSTGALPRHWETHRQRAPKSQALLHHGGRRERFKSAPSTVAAIAGRATVLHEHYQIRQ
jgi:hypothetical protein